VPELNYRRAQGADGGNGDNHDKDQNETELGGRLTPLVE
jgi:hypothetical protein